MIWCRKNLPPIKWHEAQLRYKQTSSRNYGSHSKAHYQQHWGFGNCFLQHITAPSSSEKMKMSFIFYIVDFLIQNELLIFFPDFYFWNIKKLFWIYFFEIYYFQFWIFIFEIKGIWIYFSEIYYFQFWIFIFEIKGILGVLKLCWCTLKILGVGRICLITDSCYR